VFGAAQQHLALLSAKLNRLDVKVKVKGKLQAYIACEELNWYFVA
jgi:hypothetical protein